jgi:hypothetical protein
MLIKIIMLDRCRHPLAVDQQPIIIQVFDDPALIEAGDAHSVGF